MEKNELLLRKIAKLESLYDQLQAEMKYINNLLVQVGFEDGLTTLKEAALELLEKKNDKPESNEKDAS